MTEGSMGSSRPDRSSDDRNVLIGAMFVVSGLLVAAAAVQVNRQPLNPVPVPAPPEVIELEASNLDRNAPVARRWPGLPPVSNEGDPDAGVVSIDIDEPGQIVELSVLDLGSRFGGGIVAVGNDADGVHVFASLQQKDDGSWDPAYRIVTPWDVVGAVEVPVVVQRDAGRATRILELRYDPTLPNSDIEDFVVTPEQMPELGSLVQLVRPGPIRFVLPPGEYRELSIRPRDGQTFVGAAGPERTILNGSRIVDAWEPRDDGTWVASGQQHVRWGFLDRNERVRGNPSDDEWGTCRRGAGDVCKLPELLFVDDRPVRRVEDRADVGPGTWYFDYARDEIVLGDDPSGRLVEFSAEPQAFTSLADDVRIENLVVEKYASPMRQGAIQPRLSRIEEDPGQNWVVSGVEVAWNHGYGIKADIGMIIEHSWIHDNFQMGIGAGSSQDVIIRRSEISGNCAGTSNIGAMCAGHSGGGVKLDYSDRATLRENFVHGNHPHGLHVDQFSNDAVYVDNVLVDNSGAGLHFEISSGALIEGNYAEGNDEAGILVISASGVTIAGNHVTGNEDAILVRQDERCGSGRPECVRGLLVAGNYVDIGDGTVGLTWVSRRAPNPTRSAAENRFEENVYVVAQGNCRAEPFRWSRSTLDWRDWLRQGLDDQGHIIWPQCIVAAGEPAVGAAFGDH